MLVSDVGRRYCVVVNGDDGGLYYDWVGVTSTGSTCISDKVFRAHRE